jgi:hypothetical protein
MFSEYVFDTNGGAHSKHSIVLLVMLRFHPKFLVLEQSFSNTFPHLQQFIIGTAYLVIMFKTSNGSLILYIATIVSRGLVNSIILLLQILKYWV